MPAAAWARHAALRAWRARGGASSFTSAWRSRPLPAGPPRRSVARRREPAAGGRMPEVGAGPASPAEDATALLFTGKEDFYNGVTIDGNNLPSDVSAFSRRLEHSLQVWVTQGKRGIWLRVPAEKAGLVGAAVGMGFTFHHAEGHPNHYVMLTKWLPQDENKLPANASHQVGIGAFVLNERSEVLVVQEKSGPLRGKGVWKLPTGLVNAGEDVTTAAEREVAEETGVTARFAAVLALRQAHGFAFGKSDLFFLTALRPDPGQDMLVPQESEIEAVRWLPLDEYAALPFLKTRPQLMRMAEVCVAYAEGRYAGLDGHKLGNGIIDQHLLLHGPLKPREVLCSSGQSSVTRL